MAMDKEPEVLEREQAGAAAVSRRTFLKAGVAAGGALVLAFSLWPLAQRELADGAGAPEAGPPFEPNAFIRIGTDGKVTFVVPRVEMGQGTYTALPVLLAEELGTALDSVVLEHAPADKHYDNPALGFQVTGGSTSIRSAWEPMRRAGAAARIMLVAAAARAWQVDPATCEAGGGAVTHAASGRRLGYGELATRAAREPVPQEVPLKPAGAFKLIGTAQRRLDSPDKVTGRAVYGIDTRLPGMKVAAILPCPVLGGKLSAVDDAPALAVPGVRQVVRLDDAVAVVADHTGAARKGLAALAPRWDGGANAAYSTQEMVADLARASESEGAVARKVGDAPAALAGAARVVRAVYEQPFLAHACMEPVNCTVHVRDDGCELWLGTQVPGRAQEAAAQVTGLPAEKVLVHNQFLGGGFGRRLDVDYVTQAVRVARQVKSPVKVVWSREEDTRHSTFRPYHYNRISAALDRDGRPVAWQHRVTASSVLARWLPARFTNNVDGDAIRDAAGPYDFPNILVQYVRREPAAGITTGFWRGVGHTQNAFVVESFLDELAHTAGQDPVAYRLALLDKHPRARHVLRMAAEKAGWGRRMPARSGLGVAVTFCFGSYAAQVTEVAVDASGQVQVKRIVTVMDCGRAISPDTVIAQMQGGAVFGLTAALFGRISIKDGRVEQGNFDSYRILRINETPVLETHLVDSTEEPGGVGEVSTVMIAPSLMNAIFAATGRRLRSLPVDPARLA